MVNVNVDIEYSTEPSLESQNSQDHVIAVAVTRRHISTNTQSQWFRAVYIVETNLFAWCQPPLQLITISASSLSKRSAEVNPAPPTSQA